LKKRLIEDANYGNRNASGYDATDSSTIGNHTDFLVGHQTRRRSTIEQNDVVAGLRNLLKQVKAKPPPFTLKIKNGSYKITNHIDPTDATDNETGRAKQKIKTIRSESIVFKLQAYVKRLMKGSSARVQKVEVTIMDQVNVAFQPGKMYLILGAPGCGKSTLLKMIANTLHTSKDHVVGGSIHMALVHPTDQHVYWSNLVAYIDQIDRLHPYLTVKETTEFAWKCRTGGTHRRAYYGQGPEIDAIIKDVDEKMTSVHKILDVLGLTRVKDTFVGDQSTVRGVSGGEKKRVTVAEILVTATPVICCDEISTGLDAATTFDITHMLAAATRVAETIKIVSLLQPSPETVANFDELIVLAEGKIIYFGPVEDVLEYFQSLGYKIPVRMDVADWLQALPTNEGWIFLNEVDPNHPNEYLQYKSKHLTPDQFRERFHDSDIYKALLDIVNGPTDGEAREMIQLIAKQKYHNTPFKSLQHVMRRECLLWWRDKPAIMAKVIQNTIMGILVGTLFYQNKSPQDLLGVLFQSVFYCSLSAMLLIVSQFPARSIFYKHQDARFFPTWTVSLHFRLRPSFDSKFSGVLLCLD
jgi:ABC-type multidrug transport system ATPase subunit